MKKLVSYALVLTLLFTVAAPGAFAQEVAVGPPGLVQVEEILYGKTQDGALLTRLERAETDVLGRAQSDSAFLVRLQKMVNLLTGAEGEVSLTMKLNAIEWAMFQKINEGPSISRRLDQMEMAMYGQTQTSDGLVARLDNLLQLMWPGGKLYASDLVVPKGTLVRIELITELNSETAKVNDTIKYRVADDVRIENQIAIAAGAEGSGHVISVNNAGRLGQDGLVKVDFGGTRAIDSSRLDLQIDERSTEKNKSLELAAGASLAGVVLLGPIGLAAGYFVRGKPHVVPVGTEFYVEVTRETPIKALSLVPSNS